MRAILSSGAFSMLQPFRASNGTAAAPSIQFSSDATSGWFRAAANTMGYSSAGVHVAGFDANGLILNGSTSGSATVRAAATTTSHTITLPSALPTSNGQILAATTTGAASWSGPTYRAYITHAGSCAIGSQSSNTWVSSVSRPGTGNCTLTVSAGIFSDAPWCTCTAEGSTVAESCTINNTGLSATNIPVFTFTTVAADSGFYISCQRN